MGICTRQLSKKRLIYGEWHMQQRIESKATRFRTKSCTFVCEQKGRCFRHVMSFDFRLKRSIINLSITVRHVSFIANITGGFYRNSKQVKFTHLHTAAGDSGSYKYTYTPPGANWFFFVEIPSWSFYKLAILLKLSVDNSWKYLALISGLYNVLTWECCPCSAKWNPSLSVDEERNVEPTYFTK